MPHKEIDGREDCEKDHEKFASGTSVATIFVGRLRLFLVCVEFFKHG